AQGRRRGRCHDGEHTVTVRRHPGLNQAPSERYTSLVHRGAAARRSRSGNDGSRETASMTQSTRMTDLVERLQAVRRALSAAVQRDGADPHQVAVDTFVWA